MGFEAFDRVEKEYQGEIARLTKIARQVSQGDRSVFLKSLADAWLHAYPSDKRILREAWLAIVVKYSLLGDLEEDLEAEG